jgi:SAM-dependent methyltransferase
MEKCPICDEPSSVVSSINGYVQDTVYDILECSNCKLQFGSGDTSNLNLIYNAIYNQADQIGGYDRYVRYFNEIQSKKGTEAIDYLIHQEATYKYIYQYLKNIDKHKELRILEVGSGLGYFTYALSQDGFNILGVDLSVDAVNKSTKVFGNLFKSKDLKDFGEKFDIIISTEVIEHVTSPIDFILDLKKILKSEGQILLTTPRKYNEQDKAIWLTELPPIHLFWFTTKSLNLLGEKAGLEFFEIEVGKDTYIFNSILYVAL